VLARIVPSSDDLRDAAAIRAELVEAEEAHRLVLRERERAERLVEARALPARRLDEARAAAAASEARLDAARERTLRFEALSESRGSGGRAFLVRAPFDGVVADVRFAAGGTVEEGEALLTIVDADRVHVVAAVPESSDSGLDSIEGGEIVLDGEPPIALSRPISVGRVVEPLARTIQVRFAFDNRAARFPVGRSVSVRLFVGKEAPDVAIPESAIVDDAGRPIVFVQSGGESFERRPVRLGARAGGYVHVLEGIEPGERVVHRGALLVRLAAVSSSVPAHGHVH
jgi:RND family efflux transporter, MFP subunit